MHQMTPHALWLGHAGDAREPALICDTEIQHVVQLAIEESVPVVVREVGLARVPLFDGQGNDADLLRIAIVTCVELLRLKRRTLICCGAGLSRTPAIAACALAVYQEKDPGACLRDMGRRIPTDVSPGLWNDLLSVHASLLRK
jgi:predicted protein tyrosine phosphatase